MINILLVYISFIYLTLHNVACNQIHNKKLCLSEQSFNHLDAQKWRMKIHFNKLYSYRWPKEKCNLCNSGRCPLKAIIAQRPKCASAFCIKYKFYFQNKFDVRENLAFYFIFYLLLVAKLECLINSIGKRCTARYLLRAVLHVIKWHCREFRILLVLQTFFDKEIWPI